MKFCDRILMHRKRLGLSQEELASRLGVSRQAVSKWEVGSSMPDPGNIVALAKIFGITTDELLVDEPIQQESCTPPQKDLLDRLPGFVRKIARKYGWLGGVYMMLVGIGFLLVGFLSRSSVHSMYDGLPSEITDQIFANSPILTFSTFIFVLGTVFVIGGLVLAIFLYRKRKQ